VTPIRRAYEQALRAETLRTAEHPDADNELAWQARWFSGACGREFTTASGSKVVITDFGQWNREAGPDFVNASIRIDGTASHGSIEVDLDPSGWEQHGHATNPTYEKVILHVVVRPATRRHFSRTVSHREVPQICLSDSRTVEAEWSVTAPARPGKCMAPLRELPAPQLAEVLAVAARRRFERKGAALSAMIESRGIDAALYESVATALGYKNNKLPFQLLAQRVPLKAASKKNGASALFGVAGFLERPEPPASPAKSESKQLWAQWWKQRASYMQAILPLSSWNLAGIRPANHPTRRIAALCAVAGRWKNVRAALESGNAERLGEVLGTLEHPFWSFHTSWQSPRRKTPLALIGPDRIRDIYANISVPLAVSRGKEPDWQSIPCGPANTSLRVVAARLFGGPLPRMLPKRMYVHQGLLQIYSDFCLRDHGECAECRFPSLIAGLPS